MVESLINLRRKSFNNITRTWREFKSTARRTIKGEVHPDLPDEDLEFIGKRMKECVEGKGGEASSRVRTAELGEIYLKLNPVGKGRFLKKLAQDFRLDRKRVKELSKEYARSLKTESMRKIEKELGTALTSRRSIILRQFNSLPDGFKFLVDMRSDIMEMSRKDPKLKGLERDLKDILKNWFDVGLLDLEEITWDSPASLMEKLIDYEAVHRISSWTDLKNRLERDRRCFAFFHGKMPYEPLVFIEIALTRGLAGNIQKLLDEDTPPDNPARANTAIFYSINSTQKGLSGISLGNFLIKQVVSRLTGEMPNIKKFSTLSPVPGFRRWLEALLKEQDLSILKAEDILAVKQLRSGSDAPSILLEFIDEKWQKDKRVADVLKAPLIRFMKHYLLNAKRGLHALDPVENFHLTNGARIERINWLADTSANGMRQSAGMMVNYLYRLSDIDDNHEAYATDGTIAVSGEVKQLTA